MGHHHSAPTHLVGPIHTPGTAEVMVGAIATPNTGSTIGAIATPNTGSTIGAIATPNTGETIGAISTPYTGETIGAISTPNVVESSASHYQFRYPRVGYNNVTCPTDHVDTVMPAGCTRQRVLVGGTVGAIATPHTGETIGAIATPHTGETIGAIATPHTGETIGAISTPNTGETIGAIATPTAVLNGSYQLVHPTVGYNNVTCPSNGVNVTMPAGCEGQRTGGTVGVISTSGETIGAIATPHTGETIGAIATPHTGETIGAIATPNTGKTIGAIATPHTGETIGAIATPTEGAMVGEVGIGTHRHGGGHGRHNYLVMLI